MDTFFIISGIAIILLLVVGTTLRKHIALWFKSETNALVEQHTDNVKVIKYRIKEMKTQIKNMKDQAAILFSEIESQKSSIKKLISDKTRFLEEAKKSKDDDNAVLAKEKLRLVKELEKQILYTENNIEVLEQRKTLLETKIYKASTDIKRQDMITDNLQSRQNINKILQTTVSSDMNGETLNQSLETLETKISKDEFKYDYLENDAIVEDYSEEIEKDFDNL